MTFQAFTGKEYLKIDVAGNFGLDKLTWDERLAWFDANESRLHSLVPKAEKPALFYAGILAWEDALQDKPSGYPISLDATCSGIQILSVLACDRKAASICNVVDTGRREDAYVSIYQDMVAKLSETAKIDRKLTKQAIMTAFYGSTAMPKNIFGEGELLNTFFETVQENAPGAWEINEAMLSIWDPTAYENSWVMPDNFHVHIKVMNRATENVHFLNQPFEVSYHVNEPIDGGRSLGANMVHSIDGMVVREMQRRCNHDRAHVRELDRLISIGGGGQSQRREKDKLVFTLWDHYQTTGFLSARILSYLDLDNLGLVHPEPIRAMIADLPLVPFQIMAVHDCFRCLPNYGNDLRRQYNNLLAEIANSQLLSTIVSQITGYAVLINKLQPGMADEVYDTNYALS